MRVHIVWDGMHHMRLTYGLMTNGSPSDPSGYGIPDEDSEPFQALVREEEFEICAQMWL